MPQRIVELQGEQEGASSAMTNLEYEQFVRDNFLPVELLRRCGLEVVRGVDHDRSSSDLLGIQWDFRCPVTVALTAPHPNSDAENFVVFPSKPSYVRPPSLGARHVTPTKFGAASEPPAAHYLALVEVTTARRWTLPHGSEGNDMLTRLELRLRLSLERARSTGIPAGVERITDLVAVVGVVAPRQYSQSVRDRMGKATAPQLLSEMMNAGRFVFLAAQYEL